MSVLIKGMEMPKDCPYCPLAHWNFKGEFTGCEIKKKYFSTEELYADGRPNFCPLVPVPPHGDLIDRDVLLKECDNMEKSMDDHGREFSFSFMSSGDICTTWYNVEIMIEDMPTIIPAEESE